MTRRYVSFCAFTLVLFVCCGCGRSPAVIEGKVRYKNEPLQTGEVHFIAAGGSGSGAIGADGSYQIYDCPLGEVKVAVVAQKVKDIPATMPVVKDDGNPGDAGPPPALISLIPRKYNEATTSGISLTVQAGRQTIDIDLKD
jgi:hypothetical protein